MRGVLTLAACALVTGCAGRTRESLYPVPDIAGASTDVRGSMAAARAIPDDVQIQILSHVVRDFYRPFGGQARWIDPRPLAHTRSTDADSAMASDEDWADAIVQAVGLRRVCAQDRDAECRGRQGGTLRFSPPYSVGPDSAAVFARYTPVGAGVPGEMEFHLLRRDAAWRIASKRTVAAASAEVQSVIDLLAADRAFAEAAPKTTLVTAISNMFADDVTMPAPGGHVRGRMAAAASLSLNPDNHRSRVQWAPIRGGMSSDGRHGFTFGYMTIARPDNTVQRAKYVAYWVKRPEGWRVVAYKRAPRAAGNVSLDMLPPSVPAAGLARGDSATTRRYADELRAAEIAFSNDAAPMGLGPAFYKWGAPDAVNAGGPNDVEFVRGPEAISKSVGAGVGNTAISWAPTDVIVSSTGDLGVSIGTIRIGSDVQARDVPFFTIWKRARPGDPWRYVAE